MGLDQEIKGKIIKNAKTPEHGEVEVQLIEALQRVYGYETRTAEFDKPSLSDDELRSGLDKIFTAMEGFGELMLQMPMSEMEAGGFHNGQMKIEAIKNAMQEVRGARAASSSLINTMPFVSDMARVIEKSEYFDTYYGIDPNGAFGSWLYSRDLRNGSKISEENRNFAEKRRVKQENYIKAVEKRVIESAPKWEEEARQTRLQTKVDGQRS
jgi:hypothetical protein